MLRVFFASHRAFHLPPVFSPPSPHLRSSSFLCCSFLVVTQIRHLLYEEHTPTQCVVRIKPFTLKTPSEPRISVLTLSSWRDTNSGPTTTSRRYYQLILLLTHCIPCSCLLHPRDQISFSFTLTVLSTCWLGYTQRHAARFHGRSSSSDR